MTESIFFTHIFRCWINPSYRIIWLFRVLQNTCSTLLYTIFHIYYQRFTHKYLIKLNPETAIVTGLRFPHNGPIVINPGCHIGQNCIIHPCTLLGGDRTSGAPIIGDNVFIGHGSKLIGKITIGDDVFISPGAVLTKDVEPNYIIGAGLNNILRTNGGVQANSRYR